MHTTPNGPEHTDPREHVGNADSMIEYEYKDRDLPVPLTDQERLQLGQDMAAAQSKAEQAERDKKAADEAFKGQIEASYADVSDVAQKLRFGKVNRMVSCQHVLDYRLGRIRVVRMDDGAEIESRSMTSQERQMGMSFSEGKEH